MGRMAKNKHASTFVHVGTNNTKNQQAEILKGRFCAPRRMSARQEEQVIISAPPPSLFLVMWSLWLF